MHHLIDGLKLRSRGGWVNGCIALATPLYKRKQIGLPGNSVLRVVEPVALLLCGLAAPVWAQNGAERQAEVVSVHAVIQEVRGDESVCWNALQTQRQYFAEAEQAKPWLLRNASTLVGVALGAAAGAHLVSNHAKDAWVDRFGTGKLALGGALGGGIAGGLMGPGGTIGFLGGGLLANAVKHKLPPKSKPLPFILAGSLAGAALGMTLWDAAFPPVESPILESATEVPLDSFVQRERCASESRWRRSGAGAYRVVYRLDDQTLTVDLPYEPGEALRIDAQGQVLGSVARTVYP